MSDPKDGPWDDATAHDDSTAHDREQMDGDDPPTTRATLAQQVRMRAASRNMPASSAADVGPRAPPNSPASLPEQSPTPAGSDDVIDLNRVTRAATPATGTPVRSGTGATSVVVIATGADAERVRRLCHANGLLVPVLASLGATHEAAVIVVMGEPSLPAPSRIAHLARTSLPDDVLLDLLRGLMSGRAVVEPPLAAADADARTTDAFQRMTTTARDDLAAIETIAIDATVAVTQADRAHLLFFDGVTGALWSEAKRREPAGDDRRAAAGIVGWSAHTGRAVHASPAGDDPRYLAELDDPDGKAQSRLLVQPVIGADRRTHAVLVAARRWRHNDFTEADRARLTTLAAQIAPAIDLAMASGRRVRATLPGVTATQTAATPAMQSALLTSPPRPASDSRPPPVTARRADSKPPPIQSAVTATPASGAAVATEPAASQSNGALPRARTDSNQGRAPSEPGRTRSPSDPPGRSMKLRAGDVSDPIDVAIVATAEEDIARIRRIARKARLEVSVLPRADDAPPYYRLVTLGEAWTSDTDIRVAYAARSTITDDQLANLLVGLSQDRAPAPLVAGKPQSAAEAKRVQSAIACSRKIAMAADLTEAEDVVVTAARELLDADRAYCVYYASEDGSLWSETRRHARGDDRRAIAGVTGWSARTGRAANVPRASADPRWLGPLDDPDGDMHSQLLVQPLIASDRRVLGVIVAARRTKRAPFTDVDVTVIERFAALASPLIDQLQLSSVAQQLLRESSAPHDVAALDSPLQALQRRLRRSPRWAYAAGGAALMLLVVLAARC